MATTALVLHLRSEAVLVCICQDVTRPETRHCLLLLCKPAQSPAPGRRGQGGYRKNSQAAGV